ncbi:MAG: hypothetical protein R2881_07045 [Eubacteriales bacterium]
MECFKLEVPNPEERNALIKYKAYEPNQEKNYAYDPSIAVYGSTEELFQKVEKYDVVIMLNVLHEIPIEKWSETFDITPIY